MRRRKERKNLNSDDERFTKIFAVEIYIPDGSSQHGEGEERFVYLTAEPDAIQTRSEECQKEARFFVLIHSVKF